MSFLPHSVVPSAGSCRHQKRGSKKKKRIVEFIPRVSTLIQPSFQKEENIIKKTLISPHLSPPSLRSLFCAAVVESVLF